MKYKGVVVNIDDPKDLGRIKVRMAGFAKESDVSAWALPCSMFAGNGYGFFILPRLGDEVFIEETFDGDFVYTGFFWTQRNKKPVDGTFDVRIFQTPVGHKFSFDENGDIKIEHKEGTIILLKENGEIHLNGSSGNVVTTQSICAFTGLLHPQGSTIVKAGN